MDIIDEMDINESTKSNYRTKFKKIISLGFDYENPEIYNIQKLKNLEHSEKKNNILSYLNVIFCIRKKQNLTIDELKKYRNELLINSKNTKSLTNINNLKNGLPSISDINRYIEECYSEKNYKKFIINYLIITYNTRNKDLDIIITRRDPQDKTKNYLIIKRNEIEFIRNDYKTSNKYGVKKDIIKYEKIMISANELLKNNDSVELLNSSNRSDEINRMTYKRIGSGRYTKIALEHSNKNELIKISENRGTEIGTLMKYYYVNNSLLI